MDLQALYLSGDGRISRKTWWIGTIILIVATLILYFILGLVGLGLTSRWGPIIAYLIVIYPTLNLGVKRRHDRNNNGYDAMGLIAFSLVWSLIQALGVVSAANGIGMVISIVFLIYAIYMLVQLGFLKGTAGPNNYGPDPLGG